MSLSCGDTHILCIYINIYICPFASVVFVQGGLVSDGINTDNQYKQINYEKDGNQSKYNEVRQKSNTSIKMHGVLFMQGYCRREHHNTFDCEGKMDMKYTLPSILRDCPCDESIDL